jgi:hypothetical protein
MAFDLKVGWKKQLKKELARAQAIRSWQERLDFLGARIRQNETNGKRSLFMAAGEKLIAKRIMEFHRIDEHSVNPRNFMRLDPTYEIPNDEAGRKIRQKLVRRFGARFVDRLVTVEVVEVPATTKTIHRLNEERFADLGPVAKMAWARTVGKSKVTVGHPPKRVREGKLRQKRRPRK